MVKRARALAWVLIGASGAGLAPGPGLGLPLLAAEPATEALTWTQLPPLPDREGFAGMFAGISHGVSIAAGGANFPAGKPWEASWAEAQGRRPRERRRREWRWRNRRAP